MKETVKTSRTAGYLEKIFRALNAKYFNGELEEPIITIQSTPRAYGHVTVAKAWQRGDTTRHELNIGAGTLARPIENVVATTLHAPTLTITELPGRPKNTLVGVQRVNAVDFLTI